MLYSLSGIDSASFICFLLSPAIEAKIEINKIFSQKPEAGSFHKYYIKYVIK